MPLPLFKGSIQLCTCWSVVMSNGTSLSVLISEDYKLVALVLLIKEIDLSY